MQIILKKNALSSKNDDCTLFCYLASLHVQTRGGYTCRLVEGTNAGSSCKQERQPRSELPPLFTPYLLSPILPSPFGEGSGVRLFFVGPDGPIVFLCQCLTTIYCGLAIYYQALCQHHSRLSQFYARSGFQILLHIGRTHPFPSLVGRAFYRLGGL